MTELEQTPNLLAGKTKEMMAERSKMYRENMSNCMLLQRKLSELEARAEHDDRAAKALAKANQMLRGAVPMVERLKQQVEQKLESLAASRKNGSPSGTAKVSTSTTRSVVDRVI